MADDRCFVGFDAYKQVIDSGVDVVLLATPPGFRPLHLRAAVDAGKHCFVEKPVAVDGPGVRAVIDACEDARKKNLSVVSGLCWRYHNFMRETVKRIQDGAIGKVQVIQSHLQHAERQDADPLRRRRSGRRWSGSSATGTTSPGSAATTTSSSTSTASTRRPGS